MRRCIISARRQKNERICSVASLLVTLLILSLLNIFFLGEGWAAGGAPVELSPTEQDWLKQHPRITLGYTPDLPPVLIAQDNGEFVGILPDYIHLLKRNLGLDIELIVDSWPEIIRRSKASEIDGLGPSFPLESRKEYFRFTLPLFSHYHSIYARSDEVGRFKQLSDLKGLRVGYTKSVTVEKELLEKQQGISAVPLKNNEALAVALLNGDIDAIVANITLEYWRKQNVQPGFGVAAILPETRLPIVFSLRKDWPELTSLFNKGLEAISAEEKQQILNRWLGERTAAQGVQTDTAGLTPEEHDWIAKHPVFRIGAFSIPPYIIQNTQGALTGYMPELLRALCTQVGLTPEFVWFDQLKDVLTQTEQGNIEAAMAMIRTKERARLFTFSVETMPLNMALFARIDDRSITGLSSLRGKRIASYHNYSMQKVIERQLPGTVQVMADNAVEMLQLVVRGQADAAVQELHSGRYMLRNYYLNNLEVKSYIRFPGLEQLRGHSYLVRRDLPLLQSILDKAYSSLREEEKEKIWKKWLGGHSETPQLLLTPEEEQWLAAHPTIPFAFDPSWAPVEFADDQGRPQGISSDYLHRLEKILGVQFQPIPAESLPHARELARNGDILLLPALAETEERQKDFLFTSSYLSLPVAIFSDTDVTYLGNPEDLEGKKVAVVNGYAVQEWLRRDYPQLELIPALSISQGLRMVTQGKAFAFVGGLLPTSYYIGQTGLTQIRVVGETSYSYDVRIAVAKSDPVLQRILEKGLSAISKPERDSIYHRWISVQYTHRVDYRILFGVVAGACLLIFLFSFWNWCMKKEIRRRKQTEAVLLEKERFTSDIIEFFPEAVFIIDQKGIILFWNKAMEKLTGVAAKDMLGKGDYAYAVPFYGEARPILIDYAGLPEEKIASAVYDYVLIDGDKITAENSSARLQGREACLLGTASVLRDSQGRIIAAVQAIRDVTAARQAEKDLLRARNAAEAAAKAKSEFLATMSHEIRTPMNAIINLTQLLLDTPLDQTQRNYTEISMSSSELLLSLINDILDFSKIEAGKLELEHSPFDLRELVKTVLNPMRIKTEEKGLSLGLEMEPEVPFFLLGDTVRLQQILLNFLNNAIKFTARGGIIVRIAVQEEDGEQVVLRMSVEDSGIGIPQDRMNRLFQSFSQADASTSRKYGGTGLGLAICKRLSECMGGQVGVQSEAGKGSTFWFTVRLGKISEDALVSKKEGADFHNTLPSDPEILLVEDNKINQYVALSILKKFELDADVAENGLQALEMQRKKEYDVVLMDIQMPEMDGFEATRHIRDPESGVLRPTVPIIAMTADATKEDRERCFAAGMNDYIAKPVNRDQLFALLQEQLSRAAAHRNEQIKTQPRKDCGQSKPAQKEELSSDLASDVSANNAPDISLDHLPVFDRQDLVERMGCEDGIEEFMRDFPDYLAADITELQLALAENDAAAIMRGAHKIKGMCANASVERIREVACRIESAAKEGQLDFVQSVMPLLERETDALAEYLGRKEL